MSIALRITIGEPGLAATVHRLRDRKGFLSVVGRAARNLTVDHLRDYGRSHPNRLGARSTGFYRQAADAVNYRVLGDESVVLSIPQQGLALRIFGTAGLPGGVLRPVSKKFLTIPAVAEAHGKRAGEFSDLEFGFAFDSELGRMRPALVRRADSLLSLFRNRRSADRPKAFGPGTQQSDGEAIFWLVRQVRQDGDREVLPADAAFGDAAGEAAGEWLDLLIERQRR